MGWIEQEHASRKKIDITTEKAALLDKVKAETLPTIQAEAERGNKPIEAIKFQEVKSPALFEAEFAKKDSDVVFHFWPWGLHRADREGLPRPPFSKEFRPALMKALELSYDEFRMNEDRDMGSIYVCLIGAGAAQFWFDLAVKFVKMLHSELGGEP